MQAIWNNFWKCSLNKYLLPNHQSFLRRACEIFLKLFILVSLLKERPQLLIKQTEVNHDTEPVTGGHIIYEWRPRGTFNVTEIVNDMLKRGTVCQIVIFMSDFSLYLDIQFENIFTAWSYAVQIAITTKGVRIFGHVALVSLSQALSVWYRETQ